MNSAAPRPADLRLLSAKFAGRCVVCRTPVSIGENCFYSASLKKIGCLGCWGLQTKAVSPKTLKQQKPDDLQQSEWRRLCTYLRTCLLAEAGESILDYTPDNHPTLSGIEQIFSGNAESIVLAGQVVDGRLRRARNPGPRDFLYGWPTVVVSDANGRTKVAPLFVVNCEAEKNSTTGSWKLSPKSDPDLNVALLSGRIFDAATAAEVDGATNGSISFGNRSALLQQINLIAETLGLNTFQTDKHALDDSYAEQPGVYNCALLLDGNDNSASRDLLRELEVLATRSDWRDTAAAALLPNMSSLVPKTAKSKAGPVCGPLVLNRTQEVATDASRHNRITVVTGPPGTGKSQLVVSAVANAWVDQESVLVTSTNNGAVDVAVSRASDIAPGLLMRTGNKAARDNLPSLVTDVLAQYKALPNDALANDALFRSELARAQIKRHELHQRLIEIENLDIQLTSTVLEIDRLSLNIWNAPCNFDDLVTTTENAAQLRKIGKTLFFRRLRLRRLFKKLQIQVTEENTQNATEWANLILTFPALRSKTEALRDQYLVNADQQIHDLDDAWVEASKSVLQFSIRNSFTKNPAAFAQIGNAGGGGGKLVIATALAKRALRGWACTTLSMSRNFNLEAGFFDLAIIDEASQCNIAHVLPIAYRARRLVVVGDPNQLPPIVQVGRKTVDSIAELSDMKQIIEMNTGLDFLDGSAYYGFEKGVGTDNVILLNEHYRCHPKIARWFNQAFYGGSLAVMTDIAKMQTGVRGISWVDVPGTASRPSHHRSWTNTAEVNEAVQFIETCIANGLSIGVVSPFSAQASAISRAVESQFSAEELSEVDFIAGTAHRLQGDERDVIIFSSCIAPGINERAANWVEKERNLINVAVSRAKQRLVVLGHPLIATLHCPTLSSLRSFVMDIDSTSGTVGHRYDSESERRLLEAMISEGLSVLAKVDVEGFELDFAIMHNGRRIDLEVDGDQHFDAKQQRCRQDLRRDRALTGAGWEVKRFPAWRCFVEPHVVAKEISSQLQV